MHVLKRLWIEFRTIRLHFIILLSKFRHLSGFTVYKHLGIDNANCVSTNREASFDVILALVNWPG